jgi:hypothetical protein
MVSFADFVSGMLHGSFDSGSLRRIVFNQQNIHL